MRSVGQAGSDRLLMLCSLFLAWTSNQVQDGVQVLWGKKKIMPSHLFSSVAIVAFPVLRTMEIC